MTNRCRTGTNSSSQELDRELSDVLIAISVVSRRIADRISVVSSGKKVMEGGSPNGKSKAILTKHGAEKLSEVDPAEYKALLAEVEVLGNAG